MGRARTISNEQILEAAREVFLAEGFGASTVEIARRAGVSEGSIFKRFSTKENLFFASMGILATPEWIKTLDGLVGQGDLKENLTMLSLKIIDFFRDLVPRMMMMASKGGAPPKMPTLGALGAPPPPPSMTTFNAPLPPGSPEGAIAFTAEAPPFKDLKALTRFLEQEQNLGRIRCHPEITAYMLLGGLTHYVMLERMQGGPNPGIAADSYVCALIETLWSGIAPEPR